MSKPELHERIRAVRQFSRFYTRKIGVLRDGLLCHDRRYRPGMVGAGRRKDGSLTLRWRELDSNFPYAGAMNLVFAPFVSRSIVRVLPEAHPTMAMRVTRPTRLAVSFQ